MNNPNHAKSVLKVIVSSHRPLRSVHYVGMTAIGLIMSQIDFCADQGKHLLKLLQPSIEIVCAGLAASIAIFCAFQALNIFNHFKDTNLGMVKQEFQNFTSIIHERMWIKMGWFYLLASYVVLLLWAPYRCLIWVSLYYLIGIVYIIPPFRWKRWYPLSTFLLAVAALTAANMGYERDSPAAIKTLYTVFGPDHGRYINAVLVLISYLTVPLILGKALFFFISAPIGLASSLVTFSRHHYREGLIFAFYFLFSALLLTYIFFFDPALFCLETH